MRQSLLAATLAAAAGITAPGIAQAQVGVEFYVGPPAAYYEPAPYYYTTPTYGYYSYEPGVTVYSDRRLRCRGQYRHWNGNHCVDERTQGAGQP